MLARRVILVSPTGPRNVGMVARAVANFGPAELVLVGAEPGLLTDPGFVQGAHGVASPERSVTLCKTLAEALAPSTTSVGFTARTRRHRELEDWSLAAARLRERVTQRGECVALVFGNEKFGLSEDDCAQLESLVWIPTTAAHTSLNLAVAASLVLAGLFQAARAKARSKKGRPLRHAEREFLRRHLAFVLPALIETASTRADLAASIERVFAHAPLESRDARAWHRLLRALGSTRGPADLGIDARVLGQAPSAARAQASRRRRSPRTA
jgi:TrmH family RNA methyltransferase